LVGGYCGGGATTIGIFGLGRRRTAETGDGATTGITDTTETTPTGAGGSCEVCHFRLAGLKKVCL